MGDFARLLNNGRQAYGCHGNNFLWPGEIVWQNHSSLGETLLHAFYNPPGGGKPMPGVEPVLGPAAMKMECFVLSLRWLRICAEEISKARSRINWWVSQYSDTKTSNFWYGGPMNGVVTYLGMVLQSQIQLKVHLVTCIPRGKWVLVQGKQVSLGTCLLGK